MKKIIDYFKNNKWLVLIFVLGLVILGYQLNQVIMYADDYSLGILSKSGGFKAACEHFIYNYLHWGGGFTSFIVISILSVDFKLWMWIELLLLFAMIAITIRFVHLKDGKYKTLTALMVWILYFIINIETSRETIYWLDGSIAYVWTSLQVLIYAYLLYTRASHPETRKKYDYVIFPLAAFFGGWSSAQSGALVVLISILIIAFVKWIEKKKIPKFYIYSSILTLIGYCIFFFAPGNSARMSVMGEFATLGFFSKILYNVNTFYGLMFDFKYYNYMGLQFYNYFVIILLVVVSHHIAKNEKNEKIKFVLSLSCIYNFMYLILATMVGSGLMSNWAFLENLLHFNDLYHSLVNNTFSISYLLSYALATMTLLCVVIQSIYISIKEKDSLAAMALINGIFAQGIMLMAPGHPYRTTFITIMLYILLIVYLFMYILKNDLEWKGIITFTFLIGYFPIGCALFILFRVTDIYLQDSKILKPKQAFVIIFIGLLACFAMYNAFCIAKNYKINKEIDTENIERIKTYKENPTADRVVLLKKPQEDMYGFTPMATSKWVEKELIQYFELDKKTDFMFEEEYEEYLKNKETKDIKNK